MPNIEVWQDAGYLKWIITIDGLWDCDLGYFDTKEQALEVAKSLTV